ncbi:DUF1656 domain-containing protein [Verrucomicrobia bacterium LW23]|nr:DUF1656 domain-containing protein [Verrucomicrobia bacterium LW23]
MHEYNIMGLYLPPLMICALQAAALYLALRLALPRVDVHVWHPPLFKTALYVVLLALVVVAHEWYARMG